MNLLKRRAEKISNAVNAVSENSLDNDLRLTVGLNFTCNGNIIGLLLGGVVRRPNDTRSRFPEVQIWRSRQNILLGFHYTAVDSRTINLAVGDFSPDGVLLYNLTNPLPFRSGDVLGVYQPPQSTSVVNLYYRNDTSAPLSYARKVNQNIIAPQVVPDSVLGQRILLRPITGKFKIHCR